MVDNNVSEYCIDPLNINRWKGGDSKIVVLSGKKRRPPDWPKFRKRKGKVRS